ncbi:sensor histidine kinase [Nocardioides cavernaquae]|uniref:sensor histidine kinase n=1 Tax=Nocardioides cavernaquae TaxID=2321396 RepID=UPI001C7DBF02|nr:ATP-binding protein [Nocardioides cavernaquae]
MWSLRSGERGPSGSRRVLAVQTLAGQFLALQLVVLLLVLTVASAVSVRQSAADFRDTRGVLLLRGAERLAGTEPVRVGLGERPIEPETLTAYAEAERRNLGATAVLFTSPGGAVLAGSGAGAARGEVDLGPSTARDLRAWTGDLTVEGERSVVAHVPVVSNDGDLLAIVVIAEKYPSLMQRARAVLPDLGTFLGLGLALGVAGSWLLSRLIRRRTRGLEPAEIAALADQREALLHSIREGVVAVSPDGTVTVLSDSARELLGLPDGSEGRTLDQLEIEPAVRAALAGGSSARDQVVVVDGRVVVLNRSPVHHGGRRVGTVTTLRDRTELMAMQSELSARRSVTDTLRAQTHEFQNQLHTISGLVQLGEYDEVQAFVGTLARRRAAISDTVTRLVDDPAVAALLVAKVSLAAERGVELRLAEQTALPRLDPDLSADVGTVLGNLVDNAVDATVASGGPTVDVHLRDDDGIVVVQVADTGAGVAPDAVSEVFRRGWTTKPGDASGRGVGLALVQVVCERRGGSVSVHNETGAVFTARLPRSRRDG